MDAPFRAGRVHFVELVLDLCCVGQRHEAVRELLGDEQHPSVLGAELHADMPAPRGGLGAQVDHDVEDRARGDPHQLRLRKRRQLKMQPAQRAGLGVERRRGLHHRCRKPDRAEFVATERPGKAPANVGVVVDVDDEGADELGLTEFHDYSLPPEELRVNLIGLDQVLEHLQAGERPMVENVVGHLDALEDLA